MAVAPGDGASFLGGSEAGITGRPRRRRRRREEEEQERLPSAENPELALARRAGLVEDESAGLLPPGAALALAEGPFTDQGLRRAARLLGRRFDVTPDWLLERTDIPVTEKNLASYRDPVTGRTLSYQTTMRLMDRAEPAVIRSMLESARIPVAEARERRRPEEAREPGQEGRVSVRRVIKVLDMLGTLSDRTLPFHHALGAAVEVSRSGADLDTFRHNLRIAATVKGLGAMGSMAVAQQVSATGHKLSDARQLRLALLPPQAQALALREMEQVQAQEAIAEERPELGPAAAEQADLELRQAGFLPGVDFGVMESLGEKFLDAVNGTEESYLQNADRLIKEAKIKGNAWKKTWYGRGWSWIDDYILQPSWRAAQATGRAITLPIEIGQGAIEAGRAVARGDSGMDAFGREITDWGRDVYNSLQGRTTFGREVFGNEMGLPEWTHWVGDMGVGIVFDPLLVFGRVGRDVKMLRTLAGHAKTLRFPNLRAQLGLAAELGGIRVPLLGGRAVEVPAAERWMRVMQEIIEGKHFVRPRILGKKYASPTKGMRFSEFLRTEAASHRTAEDFFDAMDRMGTTTFGHRLLARTTEAQIYSNVRAWSAAGRDAVWIERELDEMLTYALGAPVGPSASVHAMNAEYARLVRLQTERTSILERPGQQVAFEVAPETGAARLKTVEREIADVEDVMARISDWQLSMQTGGIRGMNVPEIPRPSIIRNLTVGTRRALGEVPGAGTLRALINKPPRGTILWDVPGADPTEHFRRWGVASRGAMTDKEIAEGQAVLGRLIGASTDPQRELKIAQFLESWNRKMLTRKAKAHGFGLSEAEDILRQARARGIARRPEEVYGIRPLRSEEEIAQGFKEGFERVRDPLFETQFANTWDLLDPALLDRIFTDAQGVVRRLRSGFLNALGIEHVSGTASVRAFANTRAFKDFLSGIFLQVWKPMVVLRPAYIWRVPLLDENLRVLATLGPMGRLEAGPVGARLVSRVRKLMNTEITEDGIEDALRYMVGRGRTEGKALFRRPGETIGLVDNDYSEARELLSRLDAGRWNASSQDAAQELLSRTTAGVPRYGKQLAQGGFVIRDGRIVRVLGDRIPIRVGDGPNDIVYFQLPGFGTDEALEEIAGAGGFSNLLRLGGDHVAAQARQIAGRFRKGYGGVVWGEMAPGQAGYEQQWAHILQRQIGGSAHGNRILRGIAEGRSEDEIVESVMGWLRGDGQYAAERLMQVPYGQINLAVLEDRVRQGTQVARYYTGARGNFTAARDIAGRSANGTLDAFAVRSMDKQPLINGMDASVAFDGPSGIVDQIVGGLSEWILQKPTNIINRHPYARAWSDRAFDAMVDVARAQKIKITPGLLQNFRNQSRTFAATQVRRILFDFREQARYQELFSFAVPFFQPFTEAFVSWSRIIARNPAALGWVNYAGKAIENSGLVRRDPDTGELVTPMPNLWALGPLVWMMGGGLIGLAAKGLGGAAVGMAAGGGLWANSMVDLPGAAMSSPLTAFNLFVSSAYPIGGTPNEPLFQMPAPGLSPPALLVLQNMIEGDLPGLGWMPEGQRQRLASWAFEYGPVGKEDFFPPWMNNVVTSLVGDDWQTGRFHDQVVDFLRLQEWMGMPVTVNDRDGSALQGPPPIRLPRIEGGGMYDEPFTTEEWQRMEPGVRQQHWQNYRQTLAEDQTRKYFRGLAVANLFYPARTKTEFPFADLRREFSRLVQVHGTRRAQELFRGRHPTLVGLSVAGTVLNPDAPSPVPLSPTPAVNELLAHPEAQRFGAQHPELMWALIPREIREDPDFDPGAWFLSISRGDREQLAPEKWLTSEQETLGWAALLPLHDAWQAAQDWYEGRGITSTDGRFKAGFEGHMGEQDWEEARDLVFLMYPAVETAWNTFEAQNLPVRVREFTENLLMNKMFLTTEAGKGLDRYWNTLRPRTIAEMEEVGISTLDTKGAEDLGLTERHSKALEDIFEEFPDFETAYYIFYEHDLRGLPNAKDRAISGMSEDEQTEFNALEQEWSEFDFPEINKLEGSAQDQKWIDRRTFIDSVYQDYPADRNPVLLDWEAKYPDDKQYALRSLSTRWPLYWTRFDRGLAGEKTNKYAEEVWQSVAENRLAIQEAGLKGDEAKSAYASLDAEIVKRMKASKVFAEQVRHANDWAWKFERLSPFLMNRNPARHFWEAWVDGVRTVQQFFTQREINFLTPGPFESEEGQMAQQVITALKQYRDEVLFTESPLFRRQWEQMAEEKGGDEFFGSFVPPEVYFPLGGWQAMNQAPPEPAEQVSPEVKALEKPTGPVAVVPPKRKGGMPEPYARVRRRREEVVPIPGQLPEEEREEDGIPAHASPAQAMEYARQLAREEYGWDQGEVRALMDLGGRESGWRWNAANPESSARGIAQALNDHFGDTWESKAGQRYLDDAEVQVRWMLAYVKRRYGRPSAALRGYEGANLGGSPGY